MQFCCTLCSSQVTGEAVHCVCTGRNHRCFPHTHFSSDPRITAARGEFSLCELILGVTAEALQKKALGCSASLTLCVCDLDCTSLGREAQNWSSSTATLHFRGSSSFSLSSNTLETEALGQACFILMDRNDAYNDSPSVNSTSAAMQRTDALLLVFNCQQIPVCSFSLVQRIPKRDRNQMNVLSNCSCG